MSMQDLFQALQMFQNGVKEAAATSAVNDAAAQMQQIKTQITDEAEQRRALQDLSNQTALRLTGAGASGTHIQSAFNAIAPQNFGSAEQLQLEGQLSGNQFYQDQASQIIGQRQQGRKDEARQDFLFKAALMDKEFNNALRLKAMEFTKKTPDLKPEELQFQTNVDMGIDLLDQLESAVSKEGTWESRFGDNDVAAKLDAIPYQVAITYAKVVDPASVAREGEVAAAQKYLIELGLTASKDKVLKQITNMRQTFKQYQRTRAKVQEQNGIPTRVGQPVPKIEVQTMKDGTKVKGFWRPDGLFEQVD